MTRGAAVVLLVMLLMTPAQAGGFVDDMLGRMPADMTMPEPIVAVLRRMEAEGFVRHYGDGKRFMMLYPADEPLTAGSSNVGFKLDDRRFMEFWTERPGADSQVFVFATTGGEGSSAGIWRDDAGAQHFVHLGSGSGSTWAGVMTADPAAFLRFLAVGYVEACWPTDLDRPPLESWLRTSGYDGLAAYQAAAVRGDLPDGVAPPRPPTRFQAIVAQVTGLPIPATGAEVIPPPYPELGNRRDPFNRWLNDGSPPR